MHRTRANAISKELSRNDAGETGAHQAGILIPKDPRFLSFFPKLNTNTKNPRFHITFRDNLSTKWIFAFIYYNNIDFGGTRNEYRLTRMTKFIRGHNLHAGDTITLTRDTGGLYSVSYLRRRTVDATGTLKLGSSWIIVSI